MPDLSEMRQFLGGQILQTPSIPNGSLANQTIIVTGANTGLGLECCKHLVRMNVSNLILACRNTEKGEAAKTALLASYTSPKILISVWQVDMANYASVRSFGKRIESELSRLDAVVLNAGLDLRTFTLAEDNETTLTVNVVSTFLLGLLALPKLRQTAHEHKTQTHLTFLGSMIQIFAPFEDLSTPPEGEIFRTLNNKEIANMNGRYFVTKLMVMQLVEELVAKTTSSAGVVFNCVNPGWCKTELFRNYKQSFGEGIGLRMIGRTGEEGSRNLVHAATQAGVESHGKYLSECQVKATSKWQQSSEGRRVQRDLWVELMGKLEVLSPGISGVMNPSK